MDNIAEHLKWLDIIENEKKPTQRETILAEHEPKIQEIYGKLEEAFQTLLDGHYPSILDADVAVDAACSQAEGRAAATPLLIFTILTSQCMMLKLEAAFARWVVGKMQALETAETAEKESK